MSVVGENYVWTEGSPEGKLARDPTGKIREVPFDPGGRLQLTVRVDTSLRLWMLGCARLQLPQIFLGYMYKGRPVSASSNAPWREAADLSSREYSAGCYWRILRVGQLPGFTLLARPILNVGQLLELVAKSLEMQIESLPVTNPAAADTDG